MAKDFYFNFRDVFRAGRMGFKGKKMMIHFLGLLLGYAIYEILTYLSLIGSGLITNFWNYYGLRPVFFIAYKLGTGLPIQTIIAMLIGSIIWFIIYLIFSTAVSKVTIEELRGNEFYGMTEALKFSFKHLKTLILAIIGLIGIFLFMLFWPSLFGLVDLIPKVELAAKHVGTPITTFLTLIVYFMGLFMIFTIIALKFGTYLLPSIVAVTGEDSFETIYQLYSTIYNQPWRLVIYAIIINFISFIALMLFGVISIMGLYIAFLPSMLLAKQNSIYYFSEAIVKALKIVGANKLIPLIPGAQGIDSMPWTLDLSTFFLFVSFIAVGAIILSYPMSIVSAGYTITYVILRKKTTDENMLEVKEEEKIEEEKKEEKKEEEKKEEAVEPAKEEPAKEEKVEEKPEGQEGTEGEETSKSES